MDTTLVPFHDDVIEAIYDAQSTIIYVVPKRISENLGVAWTGQYQVLSQHAVLAKHLRYVDIFTPGGGTQETLCLPLKYLPIWLAGIQARRIRDETTQAKLILYQEECADVLANYFLGDGVNINPEEPVRSTLDIIEGMTKSQLLLIQKVRRINHLTEANTQEISRLDAIKLDKDEFHHHVLKQQAKDAKRRWYAQRRFPDWVKEWMWAHAGGRCLNPTCRRQLNPDPRGTRQQRPQYDHVMSIEDGGFGTVDNCQLLCAECNLKKRGLYVDYRPDDLKRDAYKIAAERREARAMEEEKRRRQQDFGW